MDFIVKQALGGATKDFNKLIDEKKDVDPKQAEAEREQLEALAEVERDRKNKYLKREAVRAAERQRIRDKYGLKKKEDLEREEERKEEEAKARDNVGRLTREKSTNQTEEQGEDDSLLNQAEKAFDDLQQKATENCIIS